MMKIIKIQGFHGLSELEKQLNRVAEKHGIEEPSPFMPSSFYPFNPPFPGDDDDRD